jgi:hypothetical protein
MLVRALHSRVATFAIQPDLEFVQINLPKTDFEKALKLIERLCKEEAERCHGDGSGGASRELGVDCECEAGRRTHHRAVDS